MKNLVPLFLFLLGTVVHLYAQPHRNCGTMEQLQQLKKTVPTLHNSMLRIEQQTQLNATESLKIGSTTITIPVVIHVLYNNEIENISLEQIESQLEVLNQDYRRLNPDAKLTPQSFRKVAADPGIEFVLATTAPDGSPTTGITRTFTHKEAFNSIENDVKSSTTGGVAPWPTEHYLNIWICNLAMGVMGYAQFPGGPPETDGVVISYKYFGNMGTVSSPFDRGRTATHEIGHYLNLRHIWGDGGCGHDDFVHDTPMAAEPTHGCVPSRISCNSEDMVNNFMDYTDDACMNLFTKGQATRMRALFSPGGEREGLLYSPAYSPEERVAQLYSPRMLKADNIDHGAARINWGLQDDALSYNVRFRMLGAPRWNSKNFQKNSINLSQLPSCSSFEFQVEAVYADGKSGFSESVIFSTTGCPPEPPYNFYVEHVSTQQASISWEPVSDAIGYRLQYRQAGTQLVETQTVQKDNQISLASLEPGAVYEYRVKALFERQQQSEYSQVHTFRTLGIQSAASTNFVEYMNVSPQPQQETMRVELDHSYYSPVNITVKDIFGRVLLEYPNLRLSPETPFELDTRQLSRGEYTLHIEDESGFEHIKSIYVPK